MRRSFGLALIVLALAAPGAVAAVAPAGPAIPPAGSGQEAAEPAHPAPLCVVAGTLYCSEYGSRYSEPLRLVLVNGARRCGSAISDTNGSFAAPVPCGGSFDVRIEFGDKAISLGKVELPVSEEGTVFGLEIRHPGSYLELVRDVREGIRVDDITYRLVPPRH